MPKVDESYVPQLVRLYGDRGRSTRQRRTRLQRVVESRNRDAHTASLAQTGRWLNELRSDMDDILEDLDFLRAYALVAAKSVEITPGRRASQLNGVRCHGISDRYASVILPISQMVSRSEVVLVKTDRSDCLSLRPWLLYLDSGVASRGNSGEVALLNAVDSRRLDHIGLISGAEYSPNREWTAFTVYDLNDRQGDPGHGSLSGDFEPNRSASTSHDAVPAFPEQVESAIEDCIGRLDRSHESILIRLDREATGDEFLVSVRTPAKDVAVATIDSAGTVWIYPRSLMRAAESGSIKYDQLNEIVNQLEFGSQVAVSLEEAILEIGHISERVEWLNTLVQRFTT